MPKTIIGIQDMLPCQYGHSWTLDTEGKVKEGLSCGCGEEKYREPAIEIKLPTAEQYAESIEVENEIWKRGIKYV